MRRIWSITLTTVWLFLLAACVHVRRDDGLAAPAPPPASEQQPTEAARRPSLTEKQPVTPKDDHTWSDHLVYVSEENGRTKIRSRDRAEWSLDGEAFRLSPKGDQIAFVRDRTLSIADLWQGAPVLVVEAAMAYMWHPHTGDLLYLIREGDGSYHWQVRERGGHTRSLHRTPDLAGLYAKLSPTGKWLAYTARTQGFEWVVRLVTVEDGTLREYPGGKDDSLPRLAWTGEATVTVVEGQRNIFAVQLPEGTREPLVKLESSGLGELWAPDGKTMVVNVGQKQLALYRGSVKVTQCPGDWLPVRWSPDGRYLIARTGTNERAMEYALFEIEKMAECRPVSLSQAGRLVQDWHPSSKAFLLAVNSLSGGVDTQVWRLTENGPTVVETLRRVPSAKWRPD